MNDDFTRFLLSLDPNTYLEVTLRTGDKISLLGRLQTDLMKPGNSVEEDLAEGYRVVDFIKELTAKFESELTEDHITSAREKFDGRQL